MAKVKLGNNLINVGHIVGVNDKLEYVAPENNSNPKVEIRDEIVDSIYSDLAENLITANNIPPIDVIEDGNMYLLIDGQHRLEALLMYYSKNKELDAVVKVNVLDMDLAKGQVYKLKTSLDTNRGSLTEAETFNFIKSKLLTQFNDQELIGLLGTSHAKIIAMVKAIVSNSSCLAELVESGDLSVSEASKIAKKPIVKQEETAQRFVESKKSVGATKAKVEHGLAKERETCLSREKIVALLMESNYDILLDEDYESTYEGGYVEALITVLGMEGIPYPDLVENLDKMFNKAS